MGMFLRFFRIFRKPRLIFYRESWGGGMTGRHGTLTVSENPDGTEIISREEFRMPREPPDLAVTRLPPASGCLMRIQEICDSRISWLLRYSPRIPFKILDRENRYFVLRREDGSEWSCDNRHFLPPGFLSAVLDIRDTEIKSVIMLNTNLTKAHKDEKQGILDVRLTMNDNTEIDIEMQVCSMKTWAERSVFYVSKMIADKLRLKAGDRIFAYFIGESVRTRRFTITGIYQTNMTRFDESLCFTDIRTTQKLNDWNDEQCSGAEITVKNFEQLQNTADEFIEKVNRQTDKDMNTYSVWIILVLMVCVAGFTMISGLLIIILERTQMIGVLKAVGARNKTIRHTFLWFAAFIIGQGLIIGNLLGLGIIALQKYSGLVKLDPQTYYVSEAPMEINIPLFVLLNIATLIICVFVLIAPSYFISHIHPAKSMRYE